MKLEERFANGDLDAFETLFRQFQPEVYRWVLRIVRLPQVAEDLTVETFWRVYRSHARFDARRSFPAWCRRIATNVAFDYLKSHRPEVALMYDAAVPPAADSVMKSEIREGVERALSELPPQLRIVATLVLIEEQPYETVSEGIGIPVGTVKSRVFRAVRLLREKLKRMGIEP